MSQADLIGMIGIALINLIKIIEILLVIRALLSWIPGADNNKFGDILYQVTEPIIMPFRKLVSKSVIGQGSFIDISFIVTIVVLEILKYIIIRIVG